MRIFLILVISVLPLALFSQSLFPERQSLCETKTFQLEKDSILVHYQTKESLLLDLLKKLETRNLKKIRGELYLQIMVDPKGKPCCISLNNQTNITTKQLNLVNAVNSMNGWKNNENANICAVVKLIFTEDKYVVMRLGVTARSKFIVIGSTELKRTSKD